MQNRKKTTHTRNENKTKQKQKRKQHMQFFPIDTFGMERPSGATGKHAFYRETSGWFVCETSTPKFVQTPKMQKRRILRNRIVISVWAINPRNRVTAKSYHTKYLACHSPEAKVELWLSHAELSNQKKKPSILPNDKTRVSSGATAAAKTTTKLKQSSHETAKFHHLIPRN